MATSDSALRNVQNVRNVHQQTFVCILIHFKVETLLDLVKLRDIQSFAKGEVSDWCNTIKDIKY